MREGDPKEVRFETGANALALFTFLLLTSKGWLTMYLGGTAYRIGKVPRHLLQIGSGDAVILAALKGRP